MMEAVNNAIVIFRNVETQDVPEMGLFRSCVNSTVAKPRKAWSFFVTFLKNLGNRIDFSPNPKTIIMATKNMPVNR